LFTRILSSKPAAPQIIIKTIILRHIDNRLFSLNGHAAETKLLKKQAVAYQYKPWNKIKVLIH